MTKAELVKTIQGEYAQDVMDKGVIATIEAAIAIIKEAVSNGNDVTLRGFGTFTTKHRAERKARNISKGTTVIVPAHNIPYFKPSKTFKVK